MDSPAAGRAAEILCRKRLAREPVAALPHDCRPADEADAYQIQDLLHDRLDAAGLGPLAGYKIGCTTKVMQDYLGIAQPCAGGLHAARLARGRGRFRLAEFVKVGVEAEIAVRLARGLAPRRGGHDRQSVAAAVGACMASIEVVDDRYDDYASLGAPTLIADDFFNAAIVVGPPVVAPVDLGAERGQLLVDGAALGSGLGADILGHPYEALAWLANALERRDRALGAGDIVTLGSVVQTHWVDRPCEITVRFETLGEATASFTA